MPHTKPLRPSKLFFEFVVGTCIKRLLLGANEQNEDVKLIFFTSAKIFAFTCFPLF
jgi:hypothetical protein